MKATTAATAFQPLERTSVRKVGGSRLRYWRTYLITNSCVYKRAKPHEDWAVTLRPFFALPPLSLREDTPSERLSDKSKRALWESLKRAGTTEPRSPILALLCRQQPLPMSPPTIYQTVSEAVFSETQGLRGHKKSRGVENPGGSRAGLM
jgi:hypothetical protein